MLGEIAADLSSPLPMHRLLQGDVGSGKTVVALTALLASIDGGRQGALMAPDRGTRRTTSRVAAQGPRGTDERRTPPCLGGERPLSIQLLTGRLRAKDRQAVLDGLRDGSVDIVVGTHALLTDDVRFRALGVIVIDEQHRFGVEQRAALRDKGRERSDEAADPDLLVMTATPIPAHGGDGRLRRPRPLGARRDAASGDCPSRRFWAREPTRGGELLAARARRGRPRVVGPTSSARSSRTPRRSRRRARSRSGRVSRSRSCADSPSVSCTAR